MKECFLFGVGLGKFGGIFPGYVGKIIDPWDGNVDLYFPLVNGGHV